MSVAYVPKKLHLTKGVGKHREKLSSFEMALRSAGIASYNLVRVSSIFPPHCKLISPQEGTKLLRPGQI
ncbi:MAG TPA: pyruvoyl-dependent arginine decarboxylase, partial [Candidatus Polarisedimenticolia bacterium]|nr:pyruvoyl-dependent arginine decarboxylase [Candidatus Polarisedimenticolia bacterium]